MKKFESEIRYLKEKKAKLASIYADINDALAIAHKDLNENCQEPNTQSELWGRNIRLEKIQGSKDTFHQLFLEILNEVDNSIRLLDDRISEHEETGYPEACQEGEPEEDFFPGGLGFSEGFLKDVNKEHDRMRKEYDDFKEKAKKWDDSQKTPTVKSDIALAMEEQEKLKAQQAEKEAREIYNIANAVAGVESLCGKTQSFGARIQTLIELKKMEEAEKQYAEYLSVFKFMFGDEAPCTFKQWLEIHQTA